MSILDFRSFIAPAIVAVAAIASHAAADELKVGSPAPALSVAEWVQGEEISLDQAGKTYVVEFWATWCGPCKKAIPHINELYQKHRSRGLVVIGVSDEPPSTVKPFLAKMGSSMTYRVVCDDEKKTGNDWMQAAGQNGIPCAFIVRDSKILWIGNPLDEKFDSVLLTALSGRYNPELTRRAKPTIDAAAAAIRVKNYKDAVKHYDAVLAIDRDFFGDIAIRKYTMLLADANDPAAAKEWGESMLKLYSRDPQTLGELALAIAKNASIKNRDLDLAIRAADLAGDASPKSDPAALALRAEVRASAGKYSEAKELQYEAWMSAGSSDKADYKRVLDNYAKQASKAKAGG
ncbi:MAG: hypothetical protein RL325_211 [Planctomycetota bacterium]|jgi:thiol-disulfide isomerase/thioredoxin